jgi:hydrogenase maturation factor
VSCDPAIGHCITCSDEGTPMTVRALAPDHAVCTDDADARHEVAVDLVGPLEIGDAILVHAGVAIRHLSAAA